MNIKEYQEKIEEILVKTLKKTPKKKIGILFSGGIDSLMLAVYLKKLKYNFTCYTSAYKEDSQDLIFAKEIVKELNLNLKFKILNIEKIPKYLEKVVSIINQTNPINVSVALTVYVAAELAKKDKTEILFSGLGSDEIFGGYNRHKTSKNLNKELKEGLEKVYEDDLVRDKKIISHFKIKPSIPYLEKELVDYALKIPEKYKINKGINKLILRELAIKNKIPKKYALRPKKAAQYGSKFDKAIEKLSEKKKKSEYLNQYMKLGVLFSSGKDSTYATHLMKDYDIPCLITIKSKNPDSYMYHTPNIDLTELQAESMQIPIILQETTGKKEDELKDLEKALIKAIKKYKIQGIITGALFSDYQRERIEKIADKLNLRVFNPLWHKNQEEVMRELIKNDFKIIFSSIAADGLDKSWLNKIITNDDVDKLVKLSKKNGLNIAGEGGEFESLVLDCPLFNKKLEILETEIKEETKNTAKLIITKAKLLKK